MTFPEYFLPFSEEPGEFFPLSEHLYSPERGTKIIFIQLMFCYGNFCTGNDNSCQIMDRSDCGRQTTPDWFHPNGPNWFRNWRRDNKKTSNQTKTGHISIWFHFSETGLVWIWLSSDGCHVLHSHPHVTCPSALCYREHQRLWAECLEKISARNRGLNSTKIILFLYMFSLWYKSDILLYLCFCGWEKKILIWSGTCYFNKSVPILKR